MSTTTPYRELACQELAELITDDLEGVLGLDLGPERAISRRPAEQPSQATEHRRLGSGGGRVGHSGLHMNRIP